jgi:hypothetical protein
LDEKVHENLRLGLIKPSAARELALLPRGNQKEMVTCMVRNKLSYRQTQKVVAGMLTNRNLTADELVRQLDGPSHQTGDPPLERRLWRVHRDCMSLIRQWGLLGGLAEGEPGSKRAATALINTLGQLRDHLIIFMEEEP